MICRSSIQRSVFLTTRNAVALTTSRFSSGAAPAVHQSISGRTRFYKQVNVAPAVGGKDGEYAITLDGRVLKTPGRNPLVLPNINLAMAIAAEWDAQTDQRRGIQPVNMPLMSLVSTAVDQVQIDRQTAINTCIKYLPTDAALFIAPDYDRILVAQQKKYLEPVVEWAKKELGVELATTQSMAGRIAHSESTLDRIEALLQNLDDYTLTCLQGSTLESKSLLLSLAYLARFIPLEQMVAASRIEEEFQVEIWGVVEGGHDMDRLNNSVRLSSVGAFMSLYLDNQQMAAKWAEWKKYDPTF